MGDLTGKLEPEAKTGPTSLSEAALLSAAISLKRIADVMDADRRDREIKRISAALGAQHDR